MARRRSRRGKRGAYNWPVIAASVLLISAFAVIYLAMGKDLSGFLPDWNSLKSAVTDAYDEAAGLAGEDLDAPPLSGDTAEVHFIDVGQGDSILIRTDGKNILVDAGENDKGTVVNSYLDTLGIDTLDLVIGTHPHSDHIGGLDKVLDAHPVSKIILPEIPKDQTPTTKTYTDLLSAIKAQDLKVTKAKAGAEYDFGTGKLTILGPVSNDYNDLNDFSVVCKFTYGTYSFLLTGDMEQDAEKDLTASGASLNAAVLKLGHHGSSTSTSEAFLKAVGPQSCVIQVGEGNSYGHPHKETMNRMEKGKYYLYRTDLNGTIVFTTDGKTCGVKSKY